MKRAIIFDFMRTLYDPMTAALYPGVSAMLENLHENRRLILYSRQEKSREELLEELGILEYFEATYFAEKKTADNLATILKKHEIEAEKCLVVGDMADAELSAGGEPGAETIWFRYGIFGAFAGDPKC